MQVKGIDQVTSLYAGFDQSYALRSDGSLWIWGRILVCDQLKCTPKIENTPVPFKGLEKVAAMSEEIALLHNGQVVKWGMNYNGSMGMGSFETGYFPEPVALTAIPNAVSVSKTKVVTKNGEVWSWGRNDYGQVGDGMTIDIAKPVKLKGVSGIVKIVEGEENIVALRADGQLLQWGNNNNGQISDTAEDVLPPAPINLKGEVIQYRLPIPKDEFTWTFLDDQNVPIKDNQLFFKTKSFSEGYAAVLVSRDSLWSFINAQGKRLPVSFPVVKDFHEGLAVVKDVQGGWGFIDNTGNYILKPVYKDAGSFSEGLAPVLNGSAWGFIDHKGKMVIKPTLQNADLFGSGLAAAKKDGKWGYINKGGKWIIPGRYDQARQFTASGLAPVLMNGKWGYINRAGKMALPAIYSDATVFQEGLAGVKNNGLWAVINTTGKRVTDYKFKELGNYRVSLAWAATGSELGYINKNGDWIYKAAVPK